MYSGDLVLAGIPEIEPNDALLLHDPTTGMIGPVEVDKVIHSFTPESGFITIVTPRAMVVINESATAGLIAALSSFLQNIGGEASGLYQDLKGGTTGQEALHAAGIVAPVTGAALAGMTAAVVLGAPVALGAAVGLLAYGTFKMFWMASERQGQNSLFLVPLARYGRPWVSGLNGWQITDLHTLAKQEFEAMWAFEVAPTLESYKVLMQIVDGV